MRLLPSPLLSLPIVLALTACGDSDSVSAEGWEYGKGEYGEGEYGTYDGVPIDSSPVVIDGLNLNPPPNSSKNHEITGKSINARRQKQVANVLRASKKWGVEPALIHAIITKESSYQTAIQSDVGALGLMQLMPGTGSRFGCPPERRTDPVCNVDAGTKYIKWLLKEFDGNLQSAIAAYNAGEATVRSYRDGTKLSGKNPTGIKTPNGVPLASFAYSKGQKARGCPSNNWRPTPDCEGQTYDYVRKVTAYYLFYKKNPQLMGLVDEYAPHESSGCDAREIC